MQTKILIVLFILLFLTGCGADSVALPTVTMIPSETLALTPEYHATLTPSDTPLPPTSTAFPPPETGNMEDFEGNQYATVKIGGQWWMAENLRVSTNHQGDQIARRCYQDDEANCHAYGGLYTWDAAMDGSNQEGAQGLCPDGWHIPSDADWILLFNFLGGVDIAAGLMKTTGTDIWVTPNTGATNLSGFNGLPAGGGFPGEGHYEGFGYGVHYWSSTENGDKAGLPTLHFEGAEVLLLNESKDLSISVRCVMDQEG